MEPSVDVCMLRDRPEEFDPPDWPHVPMTTLPANAKPDRRDPNDIVDPPTSLGSIIRQIGPGLIIAANIVGSGELIMTTKTGAQAGISLLWLILLGCVVKVFAQLELGRFAISHGETTLTSLNRVPGPKLFGINWIVAFWVLMIATSTGQLGGIAGGVAQSLSLTVPITGDYARAIQCPSEKEIIAWAKWENARTASGTPDTEVNEDSTSASLPETTEAKNDRVMSRIRADLDALGGKGDTIRSLALAGQPMVDENGRSLVNPPTRDDKIWAVIIGIGTSIVLFIGRYKLVETFSVALVVAFTFITVGNVFALQETKYALTTSDFFRGLSFGLPDGDSSAAVITALATFGIIGVGATELISYPYWCIEKGYARSAGPRDESEGWLRRAQGWFYVMKWDAFASMAVYTLATAAFYLMGVCVLHSEGRDPEGMRMVSTLSRSYVPIFGEYARWLFLSGAIAVLYSTFLVANAGNARMMADFVGVIGLSSMEHESQTRVRLVRWISTLLPLVCVIAFVSFPEPVHLIRIAGMTQAVMLPMLGFAALYFRYYETDARLRPGRAWDAALGLSTVALLITACWGVYKFKEELRAKPVTAIVQPAAVEPAAASR
jgi:Mn2+/Fe2+ NRAMP family transporter